MAQHSAVQVQPAMNRARLIRAALESYLALGERYGIAEHWRLELLLDETMK